MTGFNDFLWKRVTVDAAEQLPLLSEHPVPVYVPVAAEVCADVECVLGKLERSSGLVPAVAALADISSDDFIAMVLCHASCVLKKSC